MTDKTYFSCAETAKLIRAALKKNFPGVKFSVRSKTYSGGASINIDWTDGPAKKAVEAITGPYNGKGFDGMIDMAYYKDAWLLPDGTVTYGSSEGTGGSMGMVEGYDHEKPHPEARKVHFGAGYIFCNKHYSLPAYTKVVEKVCTDYGVPMPKVEEGYKDPYVGYVYVPNANMDLSTLVHRELCKEA